MKFEKNLIHVFVLIIVSFNLVTQIESSLTKDHGPGEGGDDGDIPKGQKHKPKSSHKINKSNRKHPDKSNPQNYASSKKWSGTGNSDDSDNFLLKRKPANPYTNDPDNLPVKIIKPKTKKPKTLPKKTTRQPIDDGTSVTTAPENDEDTIPKTQDGRTIERKKNVTKLTTSPPKNANQGTAATPAATPREGLLTTIAPDVSGSPKPDGRSINRKEAVRTTEPSDQIQVTPGIIITTDAPEPKPMGRSIKRKEVVAKLATTPPNAENQSSPQELKTKLTTVASTTPKPKGRSIERKEDVANSANVNITDGDLSQFLTCNRANCSKLCDGTKLAACDKTNDKICLCPAFKFIPIEIEGAVSRAIFKTASDLACEESCKARSSYARILTDKNGQMECICITQQTSKSGITYCDAAAEVDICKTICKNDAATCAFNGICLCKNTWSTFFNLEVENVRKEIPSDSSECSKRCSLYHHDFVGRLYDPQMANVDVINKTYPFQSKYCICGPESAFLEYNQTKELVKEGFQRCSGLKCKQRCGMRDAICEPQYQRACLCHRENIFIGAHLWSRLPSHAEKFCNDACYSHQLTARVIERNPLLIPSSERFNSWYRRSLFSYQYDGKFCHCIKIELEMSQFRPCTDEICRWMCEHADAVCDIDSRRGCICNTHKLIGGLGRKSEAGEINCDITCRHHLMDAKVVDVVWDTNQLDGWGVTKSKFCGCIKSTTPAGLSHCDGGDLDKCPIYCKNKNAFCTREKYCECGIDHQQLMHNGPVRLPNGPEYEECGEKCRSWLWPIAEDDDSIPFIYDEGRLNCSQTDSCPPIDLSPFDPATISFHIKKNIKDEVEPEEPKKFCLCLKSTTIHYRPGTRILPRLNAYPAPSELECIGNHTCFAVGNAIHIK